MSFIYRIREGEVLAPTYRTISYRSTIKEARAQALLLSKGAELTPVVIDRIEIKDIARITLEDVCSFSEGRIAGVETLGIETYINGKIVTDHLAEGLAHGQPHFEEVK